VDLCCKRAGRFHLIHSFSQAFFQFCRYVPQELSLAATPCFHHYVAVFEVANNASVEWVRLGMAFPLLNNLHGFITTMRLARRLLTADVHDYTVRPPAYCLLFLLNHLALIHIRALVGLQFKNQIRGFPHQRPRYGMRWSLSSRQRCSVFFRLIDVSCLLATPKIEIMCAC